MDVMTTVAIDINAWKLDAACRGADHRLFFLEKGETRDGRAKRICDSCTVTAECLEYAVATHQQYGIWGGLTLKERQRWARQRRGAK